MKRGLLVVLSVALTCLLGLSALSVGATDIYPDLLETAFDKDGEAFNYATGSDLECKDPSKKPVTVYDENADAYFLRTSTSDPTNYFVSKEATDVLGRFFNLLEVQDPEHDSSFAWELMVRLPEMPTEWTYGSGYFASGGFTFAADAENGYLMVESGTTDENAVDSMFQFKMEANKWYHCILVYDDIEQEFYAFVNGEKVLTTTGDESVKVNPFRLSYLWHWGLRVGGGNIERDVQLSQDIAVCNIYSQIIPEADAAEIYGYVAEQWGLEGAVTKPSETPEDQSTQTPDVTETPTPEESPTPDNIESDSTDDSDNKLSPTEMPQAGDDNSNLLLIIAVVGAVLVIGGGIAAGILVIKRK